MESYTVITRKFLSTDKVVVLTATRYPFRSVEFKIEVGNSCLLLDNASMIELKLLLDAAVEIKNGRALAVEDFE